MGFNRGRLMLNEVVAKLFEKKIEKKFIMAVDKLASKSKKVTVSSVYGNMDQNYDSIIENYPYHITMQSIADRVFQNQKNYQSSNLERRWIEYMTGIFVRRHYRNHIDDIKQEFCDITGESECCIFTVNHGVIDRINRTKMKLLITIIARHIDDRFLYILPIQSTIALLTFYIGIIQPLKAFVHYDFHTSSGEEHDEYGLSRLRMRRIYPFMLPEYAAFTYPAVSTEIFKETAFGEACRVFIGIIIQSTYELCFKRFLHGTIGYSLFDPEPLHVEFHSKDSDFLKENMEQEKSHKTKKDEKYSRINTQIPDYLNMSKLTTTCEMYSFDEFRDVFMSDTLIIQLLAKNPYQSDQEFVYFATRFGYGTYGFTYISVIREMLTKMQDNISFPIATDLLIYIDHYVS